MPRNGSGTFTRAAGPYVYETVISETDVNAEMDDIATGLTNSLAKDGQTTPTANLPMGGYAHTNVANGSARNQYAAIGQVQDGGFLWAGTAGGTADALTLTLSPAITAYAAGQKFGFKAASNNTGAATVNVNGVGAVAIQNKGVALVAGSIIADYLYEITYDGTQFQIGGDTGLSNPIGEPTAAGSAAPLKSIMYLSSCFGG